MDKFNAEIDPSIEKSLGLYSESDPVSTDSNFHKIHPKKRNQLEVSIEEKSKQGQVLNEEELIYQDLKGNARPIGP